MVTFKLMEETEQILLYWYYPNGHEETHGVIIVNKESGQIELQMIAPNDKGRTGRIPMYADHAIRAIMASWVKGTVLKDGNAAWY
ncbi:MAG: hypothetical protein J1E83_07180 [Lachnospiraceae bacterium]|nr:hypothetical protein [Lachnospiraceae bacterium]